MSTLGDKLLAVHRALDAARIAHAVGGAISLAYAVGQARATDQIDLNFFLSADQPGVALDALPPHVTVRPEDRRQAVSDGQVRVYWGETPVDLFFSTVEFHDVAGARTRTVPFEDHHPRAARHRRRQL